MTRLRLLALTIFCAASLQLTAQVWAKPPVFPALTGRVVDEANLLDAGIESEVDAKLAAFEAKTAIQLVVVTVSSLQDNDIAEYGYQLGRFWGIGQKGKNNGVLLLVAPNERKVRIEAGYGLEGVLTDAASTTIIQETILPHFRSKDYSGGIVRGVDELIRVLSGEPESEDASAAKRVQRSNVTDEGPSFLFMFFFLGIWLWIFLRGFRRRRKKSFWSWGSSGSWSSGSGRSSGGGGGFSGGGGSFGGGGSSGSW